jgi:P-type Cu+ transporter
MGSHTPVQPSTETPTDALRHVHLKVDGMECAGCAATIQKALESKPGVVNASVSFTTGRATVQGADIDESEMIEAVASRGFTATSAEDELAPAELRSEIELAQSKRERQWRFRAIVGLGIWAPLETLHWVGHHLHWHGMWMPRVMFIGETIVFATAGAGFYRSAWGALKKRTTNMDTLISLGATTAYVFSFVVFINNDLKAEVPLGVEYAAGRGERAEAAPEGE